MNHEPTPLIHAHRQSFLLKDLTVNLHFGKRAFQYGALTFVMDFPGNFFGLVFGVIKVFHHAEYHMIKSVYIIIPQNKTVQLFKPGKQFFERKGLLPVWIQLAYVTTKLLKNCNKTAKNMFFVI